MDLKALEESFKRIMESQETKDYFIQLEKEETLRKIELENFIRRFGTKEKFVPLIKAISRKYASYSYSNRYYKKGIVPEKHLENVILNWGLTCGKQATKKQFKDYGTMFTTEMFILFDVLIVVSKGQGEMHLNYYYL